MTAASALIAARTLAGQGYPCFPCKSDPDPARDKRPAGGHGFLDAVRDRTALEELWRRLPGDLVGVATGEVSGIAVLDIDRKHREAWDWWAAHRDHLLPTRVHRTQSGGLHLVYRHHPGLKCSTSRIHLGVDVRADGGYVIWWPCHGYPVLADPGIASWPEWLLPLVMPPPPPTISCRALAARDGDLRPILHRAMGVVRAVLEAKEGERNRVLFWAACRLADMLAADEIDQSAAHQMLDLLRGAGLRVGLSQREIERTLTSALRRKVAA